MRNFHGAYFGSERSQTMTNGLAVFASGMSNELSMIQNNAAKFKVWNALYFFLLPLDPSHWEMD